jgi:hypothetical protein
MRTTLSTTVRLTLGIYKFDKIVSLTPSPTPMAEPTAAKYKDVRQG